MYVLGETSFPQMKGDVWMHNAKWCWSAPFHPYVESTNYDIATYMSSVHTLS